MELISTCISTEVSGASIDELNNKIKFKTEMIALVDDLFDTDLPVASSYLEAKRASLCEERKQLIFELSLVKQQKAFNSGSFANMLC